MDRHRTDILARMPGAIAPRVERIQPVLDWFVAVATVTALAGYGAVYALDLAWPPIRSDGFSYHVYLPATFIHHDPTLERMAADCCGGTFPPWTTMYRWPTTGRWVNQHPIGEAMLLIPFFLVADALTWWSNLSRDGSSLYYQVAAGLGGVVYFGAGLVFLRRILARRFAPDIALATLVSIVWGTNLYHYATYDSIFSHAFSFFLCAALIDLVPVWLESGSYGRAALLGLVSGLTVLVRHTNALLLLFPVLYGLSSVDAARRRIVLLWSRRGEVFTLAFVFVLLLLPQLAIYRHATEEWMFSPYQANGSFNFRSPNLYGVLLSPQKGLFFWSPILLFSIAGLPLMRRCVPDFLIPTLIVLPAVTYVMASWSDWQLGGSYGHRGFTDLLPLFAIAMASFYAKARETRFWPVIVIVAGLLVALSIAQMIQYWLRIIPIANTTWPYYRSVFLTFTR